MRVRASTRAETCTSCHFEPNGPIMTRGMLLARHWSDHSHIVAMIPLWRTAWTWCPETGNSMMTAASCLRLMLSAMCEVHSVSMSLGDWRSTWHPISMNIYEIPCLSSMVSTGRDVWVETSRVLDCPSTRVGGIDKTVVADFRVLGWIDDCVSTCAGTWSWLLQEAVGPSPPPPFCHWNGDWPLTAA